MAGNMRDRNMAFQAAESALRQAEQWLASQAVLPALGTARGSIRDLGSADATNDGLPWWTDQANRGATWWAANGVFNSGANLIPGVDTQPAYIIEKLPAHPVSGEAGQDLGAADIYLQITARGVGRSPNTVVLLQSIYKW
jgi:type IV pilus assembly protein PilX